ncbi:MAG: hypothetical protein GEU81_13435 [Nitriliruptorales bacterium]|nr:hypothetical protein [Nitriliruptorales bacterium]
MEQAERLAAQFGRAVNVEARAGSAVGPEIARAASERNPDLLVLSSQLRSYSGQPFLGHHVEYLLERTSRTVAVVVFPANPADS